MEDLFGQIECRTNSDSIVMRILRSAMDEAHEKLQSRDGPIQFLHDRSTFYELAAILVEGGLSIIQEQTTDILEDKSNKIHSDLTEIKDWLSGRIDDMKHLIIEKDQELTERLENELKLQQSLDLKDQEISYLHEKLEPGRAKNEDIVKLKSSVDQQVSNIKQKLEDETKILSIERRKRKTRLSSPNLSFDFLDKERNGSPIFRDDDDDFLFDVVKPNNNDNVLIRKMSSDIDVLKETLDLAFGRMQCVETILPLEKQWRYGVEKDVESILVKGFVNDLERGFFDNWFEFIDEMRSLCYEVKGFITVDDDVDEKRSIRHRSSSEPLSDDISYVEEDVDEKKNVAKIKKSFESIIRKQVEDLNRPKNARAGKEKENNRLEIRIRDAIARLDNFAKQKSRISRNSNKVESLDKVNNMKECDDEIGRLLKKDIYMIFFREMVKAWKSEIDAYVVECLVMKDNINDAKECEDNIESLLKEDIYMVYFREMVKEWKSVKDAYALECRTTNDNVNEAKECDDMIEIRLKEDIYMIFFREMVNSWKSEKDDCALECLTTEDVSSSASGKISDDNVNGTKECGNDDIGSLLKEDIYMIFFREMVNSWKSEKDDCALECLIREDIYQFVVTEAAKDSNVRSLKPEELKQLDFEEHTPRSRKLEMDGNKGLFQKLDSFKKCLEAEEDLMLSANSEINEHNVNNSLVISNCEEIDERDAIEWLITGDESTFSSVSEKLERALQQLYTSKELLVELEENYCELQFLNENVHLKFPFDNVFLGSVMQFQVMVGSFEHVLKDNLEKKCLRLEILRGEVDKLIKPVGLIRKRKLLYKKAFFSRCQNLKLAETEVDLLGDKVESLTCLLEKLYFELNKNATLLSAHFKVYDMLKLIERELNNERHSCKSKSGLSKMY
ncbi:hypothetical protein CASFOL_006438 [Castilleja foliolosa]|uniref:WPP domain-associated protein n=1 Tax=Castilleja foliolosa TaxID=1961234 RepID=A0ABD3EAA4_9LAMI